MVTNSELTFRSTVPVYRVNKEKQLDLLTTDLLLPTGLKAKQLSSFPLLSTFREKILTVK
jgi:hypothetical protein